MPRHWKAEMTWSGLAWRQTQYLRDGAGLAPGWAGAAWAGLMEVPRPLCRWKAETGLHSPHLCTVRRGVRGTGGLGRGWQRD